MQANRKTREGTSHPDHRFPRAHTLVITADAGGSNGPRSRLWKWALQQLANDLRLTMCVCHFPPGTSK